MKKQHKPEDFEFRIFVDYKDEPMDGPFNADEARSWARVCKFRKERIEKLINHSNPRYSSISHGGYRIERKLKQK